MKKFVLIILCLKSLSLFSQQTGTFYFTTIGETCTKKEAKTKRVITLLNKDEYKEIIYTKYDNNWNNPNNYNTYKFEKDSFISICIFIDEKLNSIIKRKYIKQSDSLYTYVDFLNDSIIDSKGSVTMLLPVRYEGKIEDFYKNGNIRFEAYYKNNRLISKLRWKENGEKDIDNVFEFDQIDVEPKFVDGSLNEFIIKEIKYPEEALKNQLQGKVFLQFIIMEDGSIDGIRILRSVNSLIDEEAIRVIKLTNKKWLPGFIKNQAVRVECNIPINFKI